VSICGFFLSFGCAPQKLDEEQREKQIDERRQESRQRDLAGEKSRRVDGGEEQLREGAEPGEVAEALRIDGHERIADAPGRDARGERTREDAGRRIADAESREKDFRAQDECGCRSEIPGRRGKKERLIVGRSLHENWRGAPLIESCHQHKTKMASPSTLTS